MDVYTAITWTSSARGEVDDLADDRRLLLALDLDLDADVVDDARPAPLRAEELRVKAHA